MMTQRIRTFFDGLPALQTRLRATELPALIGQAKAALGAYYLALFGSREYGSPALPGEFLRRAFPELVRRALLKKTAPDEADAALILAELILWESGALSYDPDAHGPLDEKICGFIRLRRAQGATSAMFRSLMQLQYLYGRHVDADWARDIEPDGRTPGFLDIPGDKGDFDRIARLCWDEALRCQMAGLESFALSL